MIKNRAHLLGFLALAVVVVSAIALGVSSAAATVSPPVISGHVADMAGHPIPDADVHLWRNTLPDEPWFDALDASTDASGNYTMSYDTGYWPPTIGYGGDYAMLFQAPGTPTNGSYYRPQWWNGKQGYFPHFPIWEWNWQAQSLATTFTLSGGEVKTSVDATIEPYQGTIDCTVRDGHTGLRTRGVKVTLYHYDAVTIGTDPVVEDAVFTNSSGRFSYVAEPTLSAGSWWTLLFEKAGYRKAWLGGVAYQPAVNESLQSSQTAVTHFQVASNATTWLNAALTPVKVTPTIARTPKASSLTYKRKRGVARFTLSAKLSDVRGVVTGTYVKLQKSTNGKTWRTVSTLKTNSSGKVSKAFSVRKKSTTYYRWYSVATAYDYAVKTGKQKVVVK
jgi:5-hydroxyisourate hydrolase-like protein (transthyretin family)